MTIIKHVLPILLIGLLGANACQPANNDASRVEITGEQKKVAYPHFNISRS